MLFDLNTAAEALDDLLEQERRMILDGRIEGLTGTNQHKEQLVRRLADQTDVPALNHLRRKVERNQTLLAAAARGLKAARGQLAAIKGEKPPMRTYGADGAARNLPGDKQKPGGNHRA